MFDYPLGENILHNEQSEPPLVQLCMIAMHSIPGYQEKEISTSLSTSPPQEAEEGEEVIFSLFLFKPDSSVSSALHTGHSFQPFHQICCPPPEAFMDFHIILKLWGPELYRALKVNHRNADYSSTITSSGW